MVGRYNSKDAPLDLNAGFAPPDPKLANWQPPVDQIPMSGNGRDSRFLEDNMWATKPVRPKRANMAAISTEWDTTSDSNELKLDGTGTWGDWGVKTTSAPKNSKKGDASQVPCTINGMNKALEQRVRAASAQTAAAYANASPLSVATKAESITSNANSSISGQSHHRSIPPHKRRILAVQATSASSNAARDLLGLQVSTKSQALMAPVMRSNPVTSRPAPGNYFTVPANSTGRRPSSTTLVNGTDSDDESMARTLQAKEFGFGLHHINSAQQMIEQELQHYKSKHGKTTSHCTGLYEKIHKIQEILWKQESMKLAAFAESKDSLFQISEQEFHSYYAKVVSMHLAQWNVRQNRVQDIMKMQADMEASRYSVEAILAMDGRELNEAFENIALAYNNKASGSNTRSLSSERRFLLTEDDLICLADGSEGIGSGRDFDSDGFGLSGDEDDDDDDDDGHIVFKGRG
ncbi:uncharacterized protein N0V89_003353 [Didymosphaeria variabile]|uniref:Uncharacterized protein n=1 Tax=Didymosphaeria variabile TaxID=1932322 RepID=A0A9W8XUF7_9PLEO|nr:uncharacterized protein N0V89_003353 [Didymosphaeria variabile]KAJ4358769.1 hypothetical protein N0V89_003353 [Didymosphaeria variabile]